MSTEELLKRYKEQINDALLDLKTPGKRHKQIPNILTLSRLLSPLVIIPTAISGNLEDTTRLAVFFGLTDLADGFIARKWNLSSQLGADLDALTDKVFAGTLLLTGSINRPYLLVNTGLEGVIASINLKEKISAKKPSSTMMGKVKTGAIFALGGLGLISNNQESLGQILPPLSIVTALLQTMTIASYVKKYNSQDTKLHSSKTNQELLEQLKAEREFWSQELKNNASQNITQPKSEAPIQSEYEPPIQKVKS